MRTKIFQIMYLYMCFAIGNVKIIVGKEYMGIKTHKFETIQETIFNFRCLLPKQYSDATSCEMSLVGDILEFQCLFEVLHIRQKVTEGSFTLDQEAMTAFKNFAGQKNKQRSITDEDYYLRRIFKNCSMRNISSYHIFGDMDIECSNFIASNLPNLNKISWELDYKCANINQFLRKFSYLRSFYLTIWSAKELMSCNDIYFTNLSQIKELQIDFWDLNESIINELLEKIFLKGMNSLEVFIFSSDIIFKSELAPVKVPTKMFQGLTNLLSIRFIDRYITSLAKEHFQDLVNLRSLQLKGVLDDDFEWLSSTIIQDTLMFLELHKDQHIPKTNMSAFICRDPSICQLNVDINKKPCPNGFKCYLNRQDLRFIIECDESNSFMDIPELPIPITGNACLYISNKNLTQLPNSTLHGYSNIRELHLDNNKLKTIKVEQLPVNLTYLDLRNNSLEYFDDVALYGYSNIRELHLANNKLKTIKVEQLPVNLTYLDLRNNSLQYFDDDVVEFLSKRAGKITMKLSENPWKCDCEVLKMLQLFVAKAFDIDDRDHLKCQGQIIDLPFVLRKSDECNTYFKTLSGLLLGLVVLILIFFYFKKSISMWLYERNLCLRFISRPEPQNDVDLEIDGFLAFSHVDLELVGEYVEKLERGPREYRLCFYQRDWKVGESIPACILKSINDSKRVIILMTNNFINSSWGLFELRSAIRAASMDKDKRLIVILYPDVDLDKLDSELKLYMKFNTYLRRDDPQFWRKLMFAMPHKPIQCEQPAITGDPAIEEDQV